MDIGNAGVVVRTGEQPIKGEAIRSRRCREQADGNDVDYVSVVIESGLVEQRGTDRIGRMDNAATRWIAEAGADAGNVITAPQRLPKGLRNLLGNKVPENRELAVEVVIDADNLFLQVGWRVVSALELVSVCLTGENTAILTAGRDCPHRSQLQQQDLDFRAL